MKTVTAERKRFSERLILARMLRGLTQRELADRVCISERTISRYESGESTPQFKTAAAIASALDISIDCLCGRSC